MLYIQTSYLLSTKKTSLALTDKYSNCRYSTCLGTKFHLFLQGEEKSLAEQLQQAWLMLQTHVNCVFDSDLDKLSQDKSPGIKQVNLQEG